MGGWGAKSSDHQPQQKQAERERERETHTHSVCVCVCVRERERERDRRRRDRQTEADNGRKGNPPPPPGPWQLPAVMILDERRAAEGRCGGEGPPSRTAERNQQSPTPPCRTWEASKPDRATARKPPAAPASRTQRIESAEEANAAPSAHAKNRQARVAQPRKSLPWLGPSRETRLSFEATPQRHRGCVQATFREGGRGGVHDSGGGGERRGGGMDRKEEEEEEGTEMDRKEGGCRLT